MKKGYTQEQLAELVDVHPRMVQMIEAGDSNILATTAMRIQAALECDWAELMPPIELPQKEIGTARAGAKRRN